MSAPAELLTIPGLDYARFKKVAENEFHGPCPRCGGNDRFMIFTDRTFPSWNWACRKCHPESGWLDELAPKLRVPLSDEQKRQYAEDRARREHERLEELRRITEKFSTGEIWHECARRMSEENREWWRKRGIPDEWQEYLELGYTPDKIIKYNGALVHTPAYTIPYLRNDAQPVTMQYRLVDPPDPKDKYRFETGLSAAWYETEYTLPLGDQVIVCEGAIKASVTRILGDFKANVSILAVPSKTTWAGIAEHVTPCGRVWVILDPDGIPDANRLAREIGKQARVVELPTKIDDGLTSGELTPDELHQYFKFARVP